MTPLASGAQNVNTLLDCTTAARPERRTALAGGELTRCNIQIVALSETRLPEEGQLPEKGASYAFSWSGCSKKVTSLRPKASKSNFFLRPSYLE